MNKGIIACYCGHSNNIDKVKKSSSGGLATDLASRVLSLGGVAYGCAYDSDYRGVHYERADSEEELEKFRGSKYLRPKWHDIIEKMIVDLESGRWVIFIGLPCDVGLLYSLFDKKGINTEHLLTVDLICHGPTYNSVAKQFLDALEKRYNSKIKDFTVRYKNPYWNKDYYMRAEFENGKIIKKRFYDCDYGRAFILMPIEGCYKCKYKGENHCADITLGDFWGINENDLGYCKYGTSLAFVHSNKGETFMNDLSGYYVSNKLDSAQNSNQSYQNSRIKTAQNIKFIEDYKRKGLHKAVALNTTFKHKIKSLLPDFINDLYLKNISK